MHNGRPASRSAVSVLGDRKVTMPHTGARGRRTEPWYCAPTALGLLLARLGDLLFLEVEGGFESFIEGDFIRNRHQWLELIFSDRAKGDE